MRDLSILIPSRNEMFLSRTVRDILDHIGGNTDIIVVLDGKWADPPIEKDKRVTVIYHPDSIGQRAATNEAARISNAKYLMKIDAHCSVEKDFDIKLMNDMKDDWTCAPLMRNLHAFNWLCEKCNNEKYQGPTPTKCEKCDNTEHFSRKMIWNAKNNPQSTSYCFDASPHFQYFNEYVTREVDDGLEDNLSETMSLQGSCFMLTRDKYFELNICDEQFGSWGSQGIEVALKTWLSGGRVIVNKNTYYAHMFRTQGGDFGFPYHLSQSNVDKAKRYIVDLFFDMKWEKQKYPVSWLVEKFWPVKGWNDSDLSALKFREENVRNSILY